MKQLFCILLAAVLLAVSFTGCAKAAPAVESIPETQEPAQVTEPGALTSYETPARFTGDWMGLEDTFLVHADAEIILPDTDRMPKATVHPRAFTQADADKMLAVFLKGNDFYEEPAPTKEDLSEDLAYYEAIARGEIPYEHDGTIDRVPGIIERLKESIKTAPNEGERFPAEKTFHLREYPEGTIGVTYDWQEIQGYAQVDGRNIHCHFGKPDDPVGKFADSFVKVWEEGYGDVNGPCCSRGSLKLFEITNQPPIDPGFPEEQAKKLGGHLLEELGITGFTLDSVTPIIFGCSTKYSWYELAHDPSGEKGYDLLYVRKVGGGALTRTTGDGSAHEENTPYEGCWQDERLRIQVRDDRVVWFEWSEPYTEPEIVEENVSLIPFEDIQDIFSKMIFVKNHFWLEANKANGFDAIHDVNVDKVQLTLMRTRPKDSFSEGTIIPVWDFWAETSAHAADEAHRDSVYAGSYYEVVLSINAIDGTVVDRELGY